MGTSLNGLTPSATYSGLIKFGDNSAITASLKALSDGNGNDTILSISTSALQIGGSTGLYWNDTDKRLGIGTNAPSAKVYIQGTDSATAGSHLIIQGTGTAGFAFADYSATNTYSAIYPSGVSSASRSFTNYLLISDLTGTDVGVNSQTQLNLKTSGSNRLSAFANGIAIPNRLSVGQTSVDTNSVAYIKGSGTTSGTTSLLVQNSGGTTALEVKDNLTVGMGGAFVNSNAGAYVTVASFSASYAGILLNSTSGTASKAGIGLDSAKLFFGDETNSTTLFGYRAMIDLRNGGFVVKNDTAAGVTASLNASAVLQADSTTRGFLPPRMTTTQKNAISSPASGLQVYDTTLNQMSYYNGSSWVNF